MSLVMAIYLFLAERYGKRQRGFDRLEIKDGLLVGLAQTIALIPVLPDRVRHLQGAYSLG